MLKHGRAGVPMEVMGLMLGEFIDDYTAAQIALSFPLFIEWMQHLATLRRLLMFGRGPCRGCLLNASVRQQCECRGRARISIARMSPFRNDM